LLYEIEKLIKEKLGENAKIVKKLGPTNNQAYIIEDGIKQYIFKTYASKNWPEDGKLLYVNSLLTKMGVRYAKEIAYDRQYQAFKGGYVIEQKIEGVPGTDKSLNEEQVKDVYKKMAKYIKEVHKYQFSSYGYLNFGKPDYSTLGDYVEDVMYENYEVLKIYDEFKIENFDSLVKKLCKKLDSFNKKPVLCHGDFSIRNVIYNDGEVVLIDWDDAMALPAYCDIARMTYDLLWLDGNNKDKFKDVFLKEYFKDGSIEEYKEFEKCYHIFSSFDFLAHSINKKEEKSLKNKIDYLNTLIINLSNS